ncbi:translocation/assembly module TamB domain-containing protein [Marivivens sp. LCG002]|uniref:translocation/assembly module TamB domain-containing protein n=1 Tax=Marivivens sp. LCG002 TaxID=3051171 RepID=UPI0025521FB6|nr:translocation/assembly module TamB domain-containing protein [Marivivens sp. LCG002]WIV50342.1 translocation/assembly module TamB domain-containing protein [Marivivens sp. LCG002]
MRYLTLCSIALVATPLLAQDTSQQEADRGYLAGLIENALSGSGRQVIISGFAGALSSKATVERLTIADADGIWLDARGLTLDWNRAALLRGAISVEEFSAAELIVHRAPVAGESAPTPEATPFALPDLPVSIDLGTLEIGRVTLGPSLLGEEIALTLNGTASLSDGEGNATLNAARLDGAEGRLGLTGSFINETRFLDLDLILTEGEAGIAARLLDLPDQPSVDLALKGTGPLTDFSAELTLATDEIQRLAGNFALGAVPTDVEGRFDRTYSLDLGGDVTALFLPQYRDFFGPDISLRASGTQFAQGGLTLDTLDLAAQSITLQGSAAIDAQGWPESFSLTGNIGAADQSAVVLPLAGPVTQIESAEIAVSFDATSGEAWTANISATNFERPGLGIPSLDLSGGGIIRRGDLNGLGQITADLDYAAQGIALDDLGMSDALGDTIAGRLALRYGEGTPISIDTLTLNGAGLNVQGTASIDTRDTLAVTTDLLVEAQALERFNTLLGQTLGGSASLAVAGDIAPLSGAFDFTVDGRTQDLALGINELDGLIAGQGTLSLEAERDENGTRLPRLAIRTQGANLDASAAITSGASSGDLTLAIADLGRIRDGLSGAATLTAKGTRSAEAQVDLTAELTRGSDTIRLAAQTPDMTQGAPFDVTLAAQIAQIADYARAFDQSLSGGLGIEAQGTLATDASTFDLDLTTRGQNLALGIDAADTLLRGGSTLAAKITRDAGGTIAITDADFAAPNVSAAANVTLGGGSSRATFNARFPDIAVITPDISGAATLDGTARQGTDGAWLIDIDASGPGGTSANVNGRVGTTGRLDIAARGVAALGLANSFIEPRRIQGTADFNLRLAGPAALSSLSGSVSATGARLSAPTLGQSVNDLGFDVTLGGNQARLTLNGALESGGAIAGRGSIGFGTGLPSALTIDLNEVVLRDPELYQTTVNGSVAINGNLAGGAMIAGTLNLGAAEIRVPSSSVSALGDLPQVAHVNAPSDVAATLGRAGLTLGGVEIGQAASGGSSRPFGLDLAINAPSKIFVRGRGLDAELGGRLTIGGTTANVIPVGQFDLVRGRLNILQQRFDLDEGAVSLQGGFVPFMRLVATSKARTGTTVRIIVEGPADEPEVRFTSTPDLPQDEVLSQLIFGRDLASITPFQAVQLAAAVGTLAGRGGTGVVDNLRAGIGLDDIDVTSDDNGNAAVRAGKYISDNIYTDVTVSSDGTTAIDLNLDLTDSFTARGSATSDGETSLGIFFEKDY